ncbi:hypothetical protein PVK06_009837 [Gossypium arboreum]|uniref:Uncharacterized protein n=2 Tax=Gossypium arboreum TaxID=29729 RepID=A0ABR0QNZ9_GOSAR|nr:hypothetical protein PVK06_009837 [Gossypium arboreum]
MRKMKKIDVALGIQSSESGSVSYRKESSVGSKHGPEVAVLDGGLPEKRPKTVVNSTLNPQCSVILKELMKHPSLDAVNGERVSTSSNKARLRRASMLKSRFADTIFNAQQKKMDALNVDPLMETKQEKRTSKTRQVDKKGNAVEAAGDQVKVNVELKKQRERDRKAARIALDKMEDTAGIPLNIEVQKEFEILMGCSSSSNYLGYVESPTGQRVHR